MDNVLDVKNFPILSSTLIEPTVRQSIRLLCVFGHNGSKVIFATHDDNVYCFGHNRKGCLGLGKWDEDIRGPELNRSLSHKGIVDLVYGFEHCLALTRTGKCYTWGQNRYGQLGNGTYEASHTPGLVETLTDQNIAQISCGASHSLALTTGGEVYAWGSDTFGQLGDRHYMSSYEPVKVYIQEDVKAISCGRNHSMALTVTGKIYVWGLNESGQLGRHREYDVRKGRDKAVSNRPELVPGLESTTFLKGLCGPNHSMLLSEDGFIYLFGENEFGQIGNGKTEAQFTPFKLNNELKIKEIVTYYENDLSIAVSADDKCFLWGFCSYKKVMTPVQIKDYPASSLLEVYAKYAKNKVTYKTVVISDRIVAPVQRRLKTADVQKEPSNDIQSAKKSLNLFADTPPEPDPTPLVVTTSSSSLSPTAEDLSGDAFLKHLRQSFNDPMKHDLTFIIGNNYIYCHKTILQIRNHLFWQLIKDRLNGTNMFEIRINPGSYTAFLAFLQFLYGMVPDMDGDNILDLVNMAKVFDEPELSRLCGHHLQHMDTAWISVNNVCQLYELAVSGHLSALERSCVEFAKTNWKVVFRSDQFQALDEKLAMRLMKEVAKGQ